MYSSKAITRHWDALDLSILDEEAGEREEAPKEILLMCRNIPLLPACKIKDGLKAMEENIYRYVDKFPNLKIFNEYVIGQWAAKSDILSSFGSTTKTNNPSENLNRRLLSRFEGKHPTLTKFLDNMYQIISVEAINFEREMPVHRETNTKEKNEKIQGILKAQEQLMNDE